MLYILIKEIFDCLSVEIKLYIAGTINRVRNVETIMPPTTAIPIAIRPCAPSPEAYTSGTNPKIVEILVIRIGRRRCVEAERIASAMLSPASWRWLANSTIKIPFFATRPISMMIPI